MTAKELVSSQDFVSVVFTNGHEHTLKAFGAWNEWCGSDAGGWANQQAYIEYVCDNESTEVDYHEHAGTEEEAIRLGILDEDGGWK